MRVRVTVEGNYPRSASIEIILVLLWTWVWHCLVRSVLIRRTSSDVKKRNVMYPLMSRVPCFSLEGNDLWSIFDREKNSRQQKISFHRLSNGDVLWFVLCSFDKRSGSIIDSISWNNMWKTNWNLFTTHAKSIHEDVSVAHLHHVLSIENRTVCFEASSVSLSFYHMIASSQIQKIVFPLNYHTPRVKNNSQLTWMLLSLSVCRSKEKSIDVVLCTVSRAYQYSLSSEA